MANTTNTGSSAGKANTDKLFNDKVRPVMDRFRDIIQNGKTDERRRMSYQPATMFAMAAGPDGLSTSVTVNDNLARNAGEWGRIDVDKYIIYVNKELKRQHINVDAVMEKKMIDYLIDRNMPKSTAEYIMKKAAAGSIFALPQFAQRTALQNHIESEAEKKYNPSLASDIAAGILSWASNAGTTMGYGGFWGQTAADAAVGGLDYVTAGTDGYKKKQQAKALQEVKSAQKKNVAIPKWMLSQMGFERIGSASDRQLDTALNWAKKNAAIYADKVNHAVDNGERTINIGGKSPDISVTDGTVRAKQYEAFACAIVKEQEARKHAKDVKEGKEPVSVTSEKEPIREAEDTPSANDISNSSASDSILPKQQEQPSDSNYPDSNPLGSSVKQSDYTGWNNLLSSMGLGGLGDTFNHLGFTLASLPDMLVGLLTGKTKSVGMNQGTMMPLAAIIAGTFIKNPLLKLPMMLWGGASLFNKMGQESLSDYRGKNNIGANAVGNSRNTVDGSVYSANHATEYRRYSDELLDRRISNPVIEGDRLVLDIDNVPRIVTLTPQIVEAYNQGALPINTLANRVLAKSGMIQQAANVSMNESVEVSRHYEQSQQVEQSRGIR